MYLQSNIEATGSCAPLPRPHREDGPLAISVRQNKTVAPARCAVVVLHGQETRRAALVDAIYDASAIAGEGDLPRRFITDPEVRVLSGEAVDRLIRHSPCVNVPAFKTLFIAGRIRRAVISVAPGEVPLVILRALHLASNAKA